MKKEYVDELNKLSEELKLPKQLFRVIVADSMVLTESYKDPTKDDDAFDVSLKALKKANPNAFVRCGKLDYDVFAYGKQLVQEVIKEKENQAHR
jgi:hypothetical protein